jgi:large subunit ribosomal protein L10
MPSEKVLKVKQQMVADLVEKLKSAQAGVLCDYKGITVDNDTKLRRALRKAGVEYVVVKNTLLRRVVKETGMEDLDSCLTGMTSLAYSEDPVAPAKVIAEFIKKTKGTTFAVKAGFVDGKVIDVKGVNDLAELPSREVLLAQVLGGFNAPITGLANVLNGNIRGLVVALQAIADQKSA